MTQATDEGLVRGRIRSFTEDAAVGRKWFRFFTSHSQFIVTLTLAIDEGLARGRIRSFTENVVIGRKWL